MLLEAQANPRGTSLWFPAARLATNTVQEQTTMGATSTIFRRAPDLNPRRLGPQAPSPVEQMASQRMSGMVLSLSTPPAWSEEKDRNWNLNQGVIGVPRAAVDGAAGNGAGREVPERQAGNGRRTVHSTDGPL